MKLLALALCAGFTYLTYRLYVQDNIAVLPVGIFTLFTYWLAYEVSKWQRS